MAEEIDYRQRLWTWCEGVVKGCRSWRLWWLPRPPPGRCSAKEKRDEGVKGDLDEYSHSLGDWPRSTAIVLVLECWRWWSSRAAVKGEGGERRELC